MTIIYGISNCDTMKKAITWLKSNQKDFIFHDYKKAGITESKLADWLVQVPWDQLINRKGTTWKQLSEEEKLAVNSDEKAIQIMVSKQSAIKRPILEIDGVVAGMGFDEEGWQKIFA